MKTEALLGELKFGWRCEMNKQHVMVDLETLGNNSSSVIISIGAVAFDLDKMRLLPIRSTQ